MMKRLVAIPLLLMMLFSGVTVQIASHYCKGSYSGSKVSLDGKLASCGMEDMSVTHSSEDIISSHCCSDVISSVAFSTNYISSACTDLPDPRQEINHFSLLSNELIASREICFPLASDSVRPPGLLNCTSIEQQVLCIFRI
jgi:hypothetical protein